MKLDSFCIRMLQMVVMERRIGSKLYLHCNFQMIVIAWGEGDTEINWCFGDARKASFRFKIIIYWEI